MKKVLFATTALVATAGVAAADVSFGGYGRFGVLYVENAAKDTRIESRFRLNIDGSTEADGGVTFGARVRMQADDTATAANAASLNGARFYAMTGGLTVGVGNIYGAIDSMPNLYTASIGLSGLGWHNVVSNFDADSYSSTGAGRNGVEVIYEGGGFGAHVSSSNTGGTERTAIALSYTWNDWTFAAAYQDSNVADDVVYAVTVGGEIGPVTVSVMYAEDDLDQASATLAGEFEVGGATTVLAFYNNDDENNGLSADSYGLGLKHSLGGGVSIRGGVVSAQDVLTADMGVLFNF
ncbi:porin [Pseudooceanicola sp. 216_PA32_1]|uniref:Porin n=1 Tax=Pseudooceanicola pacificus TaxID=2676438 RepID=A0A844W1J5_9RHOB|nr:porin [Pseudooceanicola pacificus]MWB76574.1 porin [Pseudooceanicola pacificus]